MPQWLVGWYESAWASLGALALRDYDKTTDPVAARLILAVLALWKELMEVGTIAGEFTEEETRKMLALYL